MNILITGANLINKGAQSMLFVTVDQMRRLYPNCTVYYGSYRGESLKAYTFKLAYYDPFVKRTIISGKFSAIGYIKQTSWNFGKYILRKSDSFNRVNKAVKELQCMDLILDISGYALSDRWGYEYNEKYLDNIRLARKLNIPICLMPQSFGPFDYEGMMDSSKAKKLKSDISELLKYPVCIFAREVDSKHNLEELGVKDVCFSHDLVLQSRGINRSNVLINRNDLKSLSLKKHGNSCVAIIPNQQISSRGYKDKLLIEYSAAVNYLTKHGYDIVIIKHSSEDAQLCNDIYKYFKGTLNISYMQEDLNCLEYSEYIRNFDLVISSRFHAAVHALKESVPTITVGWAIKYIELMESLDQKEYAFDITTAHEEGTLGLLVQNIINELNESRMKILTRLTEIQSINCFDIVGEKVRNVSR